jgi:hypothetical protein
MKYVFKQGNTGRPKGAMNKNNKRAKQIISEVLLDELANIKQLLNELSPVERAYVICKLLPYVVTKEKHDEHEGELVIKLIDESTSTYDVDKY